jgi:tRNA dimethylallyltransferase
LISMAETASCNNKNGKILAVLGPTGCGKSSFAVELALSIGGEIVSSDSMAVYKGVDIGTDKMPIAGRKGIPHHLYDVAETGTYFSAGLFREKAIETIAGIRSRNKIPIVVGGTGLYARCLLEGLSPAPSRDEAVRDRLKKMIADRGLPFLYRMLQRFDKKRAGEVSQNDELRIIRALEVRIITGKPFSEIVSLGTVENGGFSDILKLCLTLPRPLLYERIERRVDQMIKAGIVDEARILWKSGRLAGPVSKAIGYKELIPFFEGSTTLDDSVAEIKKNSRNLAKRQLTWFRKENGLEWIRMEDERERKSALARVKKWFEGENYEQ